MHEEAKSREELKDEPLATNFTYEQASIVLEVLQGWVWQRPPKAHDARRKLVDLEEFVRRELRAVETQHGITE